MKKFFLFLVTTFISFTAYSQEIQKTGFVKFNFNADSVLIVIDYDFTSDSTIASGDSLELTAGTHTLELNVPFSKKITRDIIIYEDNTTIQNIIFYEEAILVENLSKNYASRKFFGVNTFLMTDEDSEIVYNGELLGNGFAKIDLELGNHSIELVNPDFGRKKVSVNGFPFLEIYEIHLRPDEKKAKTLSFIPGASQYYKKQYFKSAVFGTLFPSSFLFTVFSGLNYQDEKDLFDTYSFNYTNAETQSNALLFGDLAEEQRDITQNAKTQFQIGIVATSLIYVANVFDGLRSNPQGGYRFKKPLDFYVSTERIQGLSFSSATFRYNFSK